MKKKFWLSFVIFIILPIILAELLFRCIPFINNFYLSKTDVVYSVKPDSNKIHYYFIGSSHVAAAIDEQILNDQLKSDSITAFNVGRGTSTGTVFYLALEKLAREGLLNNAKVFLEAPRGISFYTESKFGGEWINSQNIHLLIPYLDTRSFIEFWKYSGNTFPTKIDVSLNYLFYTMRVSSLIREILQRNSFKELIDKILGNTGNKMINEPEIQSEQNLTAKGGIKVDSMSVADARKLAYAYFNEVAHNQKIVSVSGWQQSRLNDIIKLLDKYNAELVLYDMPISSVEAQIFQTDIANQNRQNFRKYLDDHQPQYISFDFSTYTDADFPDLWHVSKDKSVEYTYSFAKKLQH